MPRLVLLAAAVGLALAAAPVAAATIDGPCKASIAGVSVADRGTSATSDAITVANDAKVRVSMSAAKPIDQLKVSIEFAGLSWTVHDRPTSGTSWSSIVNVDDYAKYGVGLYKVVGSSSGSGLSCSGAALVKVEGSPLSTVAGLVGLGMAVLGGVGLALLALRGPGSGGRRALGALLGIVFAVGLGVLLQEFSLVYPTQVVAIVLLAGGAVLGLLLPGLKQLLA
jgi:hypothetical protein